MARNRVPDAGFADGRSEPGDAQSVKASRPITVSASVP
jgi:hypothetical protein